MQRKITIEELQDIGFSGLSNEEKETAINWYAGDDVVVLSTSDNKTLTKLKRIARESPELIKIRALNCFDNGVPYGITVEIPRKLLKFATKMPAKREYTEEERAALRERFKK